MRMSRAFCLHNLDVTALAASTPWCDVEPITSLRHRRVSQFGLAAYTMRVQWVHLTPSVWHLEGWFEVYRFRRGSFIFFWRKMRAFNSAIKPVQNFWARSMNISLAAKSYRCSLESGLFTFLVHLSFYATIVTFICLSACPHFFLISFFCSDDVLFAIFKAKFYWLVCCATGIPD